MRACSLAYTLTLFHQPLPHASVRGRSVNRHIISLSLKDNLSPAQFLCSTLDLVSALSLLFRTPKRINSTKTLLIQPFQILRIIETYFLFKTGCVTSGVSQLSGEPVLHFHTSSIRTRLANCPIHVSICVSDDNERKFECVKTDGGAKCING